MRDKNNLREIAVKLNAFSVIEGGIRASITVPWDDFKVKTYNGSDTRSGVVTMSIKDDNLIVTHHERGTPDTTGARVEIYRGPIKWLKGVRDYDKPIEEDS